jgi:hypothetical protein
MKDTGTINSLQNKYNSIFISLNSQITSIVSQLKSSVTVLDVNQHKHQDKEEIQNIHNHSHEFVHYKNKHYLKLEVKSLTLMLQ